MIEFAHIQNCHSHKDTLVEFHPGVNAIIGDTDSGKSALLRGLDYCIWNNGSSKSLLSHWGGILSVSIGVDGKVVTRKSDKKEIYLLDDLELHSFGKKVPSEIEDVFNMGEINRQEQIDTFFLLTETPGYVSSYLNKIANLEQIDSTTKSIKSELNEKKRLIEHQKEDVKKKEAELESFAFLSEFKQELNEADTLQSKITDLTIEINVLTIHLDNFNQIKSDIQEVKKIIELKPYVESVLELNKNKVELIEQITKLELFEISMASLVKKESKLTKLLTLKSTINETLTIKNEQSILSTKLDSLNAITSKLSTINTKLENTNAEIDKDKLTYETELHKLGKCFFCGSKLK